MPIKRRTRAKKSDPEPTPVEETVVEETVVEETETTQPEITETVEVEEQTEQPEITEPEKDEIIEEIQEVVQIEDDKEQSDEKPKGPRRTSERPSTHIIQEDDKRIFQNFSKIFTNANMGLNPTHMKRQQKIKFEKVIENELARKPKALDEISAEEKEAYKSFKERYINQTMARNQSDLIIYQTFKSKNKEYYCNSVMLGVKSDKFRQELAKYRANKGPDAKYYIKCKMPSEIMSSHLFKILEAIHTGKLSYNSKNFKSLWELKHHLRLPHVYEAAFLNIAVKLGYTVYKNENDKEKNITMNEKLEKDTYRRFKNFIKRKGEDEFIVVFGNEKHENFKELEKKFGVEEKSEEKVTGESEVVSQETEGVTEEVTEDVTEEVTELVTEEVTEEATGEEESKVEEEQVVKILLRSDITKKANGMGSIKIIDEEIEKAKEVADQKKVVVPAVKTTKINSNKSAIQVNKPSPTKNQKSPNKRGANVKTDAPKPKIRKTKPNQNYQQNNRKTMPMPNFKSGNQPIARPMQNYGMPINNMYGMPMNNGQNNMRNTVPAQNMMPMQQPMMMNTMGGQMQPMMMNNGMRPVMMQNNQPYYGNGN